MDMLCGQLKFGLLNEKDWIEQKVKRKKVMKIDYKNQINVRAIYKKERIYLKVSIGINLAKQLKINNQSKTKVFIHQNKSHLLLEKSENLEGYKFSGNENKNNYFFFSFVTDLKYEEVILDKNFNCEFMVLSESNLVISIDKIFNK
jgi:hypothetical protein